MLAPLLTLASCCFGDPTFAAFAIPGHERDAHALNALFALHHPGSGPKATLWDAWLPGPALWPAIGADGRQNAFDQAWKDALSSRVIDADGYVATHQHASIAHPLGWPFPFWTQGKTGVGFHFSFEDTVGPPWRPEVSTPTAGCALDGADDRGLDRHGWTFALRGSRATWTTPPLHVDVLETPFVQLRWRGEGLESARIALEFTTDRTPEFSAERRIALSPPTNTGTRHDTIETSAHPEWRGIVTGLRIVIDDAPPAATLTLQALFTQFDTRHTVNNAAFLLGMRDVWTWTGDDAFLCANASRIRAAARYLVRQQVDRVAHVVGTRFVGHDGRSGLEVAADGSKTLRAGVGIGGNYWDLLPFGGLDAYATVQAYAALDAIATLEAALRERCGSELEPDFALDPEWLGAMRGSMRTAFANTFWNEAAGRFGACVDVDGVLHDYGYTFLNEEAIARGLVDDARARRILDWIDGVKPVEGDTAVGDDVFAFRFGPRSSTRRNVEWYGWYWSAPESIPFGGQVQDGGAVLGFSSFDLLARIAVRGPDDAWERLREILRWFDEVQAAGGYRAYYDGKSRPGTLQGCGTAGGLGLDCEFFESVLTPHVVLSGFAGIEAIADGLAFTPRLPKAWPQLRIAGLRIHGAVFDVVVTSDGVALTRSGGTPTPLRIRWTDDVGDHRGAADTVLAGDADTLELGRVE
ncbi:MAG: hypothetical protein IPH13_16110 [Planctomycetes bacterium]|nr:hypothetical protein [Planctomycetota bacterium]